MMEQYIRQQQNTVAQYIATQSLLNLCEGSEIAPGARVGMQLNQWCRRCSSLAQRPGWSPPAWEES